MDTGLQEVRWRRTNRDAYAAAAGFPNAKAMDARVLGTHVRSGWTNATPRAVRSGRKFDRVDTGRRESGPLTLPIDMVKYGLPGFYGLHVSDSGTGPAWVGRLAADEHPGSGEPFLSPDRPVHIYSITAKPNLPMYTIPDPHSTSKAPLDDPMAFLASNADEIPPSYILFAPVEALPPGVWKHVQTVTPRSIVQDMMEIMHRRGDPVPTFESGDPQLTRAWRVLYYFDDHEELDRRDVTRLDLKRYFVPEVREELTPLAFDGDEYTDDELIDWLIDSGLPEEYNLEIRR